jgi:hypothetical protein
MARVSRYQGVTPPSVAAMGMASGYCTPAPLSFCAVWPRPASVVGKLVTPALCSIFALYIVMRKSFE